MPANAPPNLFKGMLFVIIAFFFMACFGAFTKAATLSGDPLWVSFIMYTTGLLMLCGIVLYKGYAILVTNRFKYLVGRALFGVISTFFYMLSVKYIPLIDATLFFNTTPLFIPILAIFMLGDHVDRNTWLSILLGFIGIVIIMHPSLQSLKHLGDILGICSGIFLAIAFIFVKVLIQTEPPARINFYFFLLSVLVQIPFLYWAGPFPDFKGICFAICGGASLALMQAFLANAFLHGEASKIGIFQYVSIVFVGIFDWVFWGVVPPAYTFLGVILVVIAGIIIIRTNKLTIPSELK
ncbi:MAG: hypothetical protein CK425_04405 [Parachlamydia sp.]|nr:MAG: hypothetical protein CK425_04405 [Parachlamydia sp.]